MKSRLVDYSFLNSRVSGMYSRFIDKGVIARLIKSESLIDFISALRSTDYNKFLFGIKPSDLNVTLVESVFLADLFDTYQKIAKFLKYEPDRSYIQKVMLLFELRNVKKILKGKLSGLSEDALRKDLMNIGEYSVIDTEYLIRAQDVEEVIKYLSANPAVGDIIRFAYESYKKDKSVYVFDSAIDVHYLLYLYNGVEKLNGYDRDSLKEFYGTQIDLMNIIWVLRLRFNYGIEPAEVMVDLIPLRYKISDKLLKEIVYESDISNVYAKLAKFPWVKYIQQEKITIDDIERGAGCVTRDMARRMYRKEKFCLSSLIGFLTLKRFETFDLVKILEGKEYNVADDDIRKRLILL